MSQVRDEHRFDGCDNCRLENGGSLFVLTNSSGTDILLCGRCYYLRQIYNYLYDLGTPYETRCSLNTLIQVHRLLHQEWLIHIGGDEDPLIQGPSTPPPPPES